MERYEQKLLRYIHRLINTTDAEDILQEVFIKAYQNLHSFNQKLSFSAWIYRITYNHTISYYRKNQKHDLILQENDTEVLITTIASDLNIPQATDQKITNQRIQLALQKLKSKYKDVLVLRYLEDKDYTEIADILKKPSGTIATLLNRAKKKLKQILLDDSVIPQL